MEIDVIDDILNSLDKNREAIPEVIIPEPKVVAKLKSTEWVDIDPTHKKQQVPFSKLYWKPSIPDHLVTVFEGYEAPTKPDPYVPSKKEFEALSLSLSLGLKVNLVGPTGAGKTLMYEYYAATTGRPYLRIEHNVELDKAAIFGQTHINVTKEGSETDFVLGVLPESLNAPTMVVLDELSRATGHANMIYQRLLDRRELFLPECKDKTKSLMYPHPDWVIAASDNTKGNGDDMDKYPMSNIQDASFINRWDTVIEVDYLSIAQEATLIKDLSSTIESSERDALAKFSSLCHSGFKKGDITTAFSPRNLVAICKFRDAGVALRQAIDMNYTSRCGSGEKQFVSQALTAAFGRS